MASSYNLYVVRLDARVWGEAKFRKRNAGAARRHAAGEPVEALYVGYSAHKPECRFSIHRGAPLCSCNVKPGEPVKEASSSWVRHYRVALDSGRCKLGVATTPATAMKAEKAYEKALRKAGAGVWRK